MQPTDIIKINIDSKITEQEVIDIIIPLIRDATNRGDIVLHRNRITLLHYLIFILFICLVGYLAIKWLIK